MGIKQSVEKDEENLAKIARKGIELELVINDEKKKAYWSKLGFDSRLSIRAYVKKRIKQAVKEGLLSPDSIETSPIGLIDGKNTTFFLFPSAIDYDSLEIYENDTLKLKDIDYTYDPNLRVVFFNKPPSGKLKAKYNYYDQEIFDGITNNASLCMFLYLSLREPENKQKKIFNSPEEVGELSDLELVNIVNKYMQELKISEEDLKNLQAPLLSGQEEVMPKDGELISGEKKYGENLPEVQKSE